MKKVGSLILFAVVLSVQISAQKSLAIGGYFSPSYTSRLTSSSEELSWLNTDMNNISRPGFGYSLGVFGEDKISEKLSVRAGLGYLSMVENIDSLTGLGLDLYKSNYRFVELPVVASYSFGSNKYVRPYVSFGYVLNYFINNRITYSYAGSNNEETSSVKNDFNSINHAVRISFGYDFVLDKKWNLRTECFANSFVSSLTNQGITRRPIAFGLSLNLRKSK
jgi:outer membrane protein W